MKKNLEIVLGRLIGTWCEKEPLSGIDIVSQFQPDSRSVKAIVRNLNSSFLITLCGPSHRYFEAAAQYLESFEKKYPEWRHLSSFYDEGIRLIAEEFENTYKKNTSFKNNLDELCQWLIKTEDFSDVKESLERIWKTFFPEGVSIFQKKQNCIDLLRGKRKVDIIRINTNPIQDPAKEIIFTSNVLLTLPPSGEDSNDINIPDFLVEKIKGIAKQPQLYWYDHPTWIGVEPDKSEVIYGLRGLNDAIAYEKNRGNIEQQDKVRCILSISVTHSGLQKLAKEWLFDLLGKSGDFDNLIIYAFAESGTSNIVEHILEPAAVKYLGKNIGKELNEIFGVNGPYGRHYNFLKAISAFWQVFLDPKVRATFKIDLDQVFPQDNLVRETGRSAFEHLMTPLWGADGIDYEGRRVKLGMLAGALVNYDDIESSLFTPDVKFPDEGQIQPNEWIFCSRLPQAVSTEAEMMVRYDGQPLDGRQSCIQRVHVTGGTCGILIENLREFKPFTPSFINRAEDQAYLLSVLGDKEKNGLRYVHADGLIMRHDKEAFATAAIQAASIGKMIGDYERILFFSRYAEALPWGFSKIKEITDPFTGCFISSIPITLIFLGFALKSSVFFENGMLDEAFDFINIGSSRLLKSINEYGRAPIKVKEIYEKEKRAWENYYLLLDIIEKAIMKGDSFALELKDRAERYIMECRIIP
ncbi:hypothetical protein ACFL2O_11640 [Thermodesulfobacteriota bacterium]